MSNAIVLAGDSTGVPAPAPLSGFLTHRRRVAAPVLVAGTTASLLSGILLLSGSWFWGLAAYLILAVSLNWGAAIGAGRLRSQLTRVLPEGLHESHFVGVRRSARVRVSAETVDNVALAELGADCIRLHLEEKTISIPNHEIRRIDWGPVQGGISLKWIEVEYYRGNVLEHIYLTSREGRSLLAWRRATRTLYESLVVWRINQAA